MAARVESESLYGSSIFHDGHAVDDVDLPEYVQLGRRLFPALLDDGNENVVEPEVEEGIARYLKYLMGLPLASLRMEPALLQADLQRTSKELTMLLLNETARPTAAATVATASGPVGRAGDGNDGTSMFDVVSRTGTRAAMASSMIASELAETQSALGRLEAACGRFTAEIAGLDQQARVVQRVLDKQDVIARIVELPRVMQMCVAGGYYEEAVDIAEHVRVTGDRLVRDIRDGAHVLPGSAAAAATPESPAMTAAARDQLVGFVCAIQAQVNAEFEAMVRDLCRELAHSHSTSVIAAAVPHTVIAGGSPAPGSRRGSDASAGGAGRHGGVADSGYERSMKRLSQVANIVGILRRVGLFSEAELRMLFLRSRWQAWLQTSDALSAYAPPMPVDMVGGADSSIVKTASSMACVPAPPQPPLRSRRGADRGRASMEVAAYLAKVIDAFFSWLADMDMQYTILFSKTTAGGCDGEPLADLATFASQQFLAQVLPPIGLLSEASGVASLQSLIASHAPVLERGAAGLALPLLAEALRERAFSSVVWGIEAAVADACDAMSTLGAWRESPPGSLGGGAGWEQLAAPTRPLLELPSGLSTAPGVVERPSKFLGQYRVSPVGLLQYPLLAALLGTFRDCLHALRVLVLADDDAGGGAPVLLAMTSVVLESELVRAAEALAALCARTASTKQTDEHAQRAASDACAAFVFGLVRNVAEIFEEVATLSEPALAAGYGIDSDESPASLYSAATYAPLVACLSGASQSG
ncbi:hypothetical protein LPJ61_000393 [Coemansia biformis]|uniref:Conserved oligomeric Golgi complex subunit 8 n=1 Tax=Coemansia biformis TaxID=1286918 RepID=A0A9W7YHZ0_9FUNG|nr:hypothetical protein LPJ61_000393 [Coemansia biformis]